MNPEQVLTRATLTEGATTLKTQEAIENQQLQVLANELKLLIKQEATV